MEMIRKRKGVYNIVYPEQTSSKTIIDDNMLLKDLGYASTAQWQMGGFVIIIFIREPLTHDTKNTIENT